MSQHKSFKKRNTSKSDSKRNVLKRFERVKMLNQTNFFIKNNNKVTGLPKK